MKLRNKKTGQDGNFIINKDHFECVDLDYVPFCFSLSELLDEWEDAPRTIWYITHDSSIHSADIGNSWTREKNIGNYFETREEAERVVEYLKALAVVRGDGTSKFTIGEDNWRVYYSTNTDYLYPDYDCFGIDNGIFGLPYFATEEDAQRSIEQHKNEWLTIFGVKEEVCD